MKRIILRQIRDLRHYRRMMNRQRGADIDDRRPLFLHQVGEIRQLGGGGK